MRRSRGLGFRKRCPILVRYAATASESSAELIACGLEWAEARTTATHDNHGNHEQRQEQTQQYSSRGTQSSRTTTTWFKNEQMQARSVLHLEPDEFSCFNKNLEFSIQVTESEAVVENEEGADEATRATI
jgi:hypothetical protein